MKITAFQDTAAATLGGGAPGTVGYPLGGSGTTLPSGAAGRLLSLKSDGTTAFWVDQWINVQDWGTVGNDSTDDTAAIQAALNATPRGGTCFFPIPSSAYKITAQLTIPREMRLAGGEGHLGQYTKIRQATANTNAFLNVYDGIAFDGLQVVGTIGGQASGAGLYTQGSVNLRRCLFQGFYTGVTIDGGAAGAYPVHASTALETFFDSATSTGLYLYGVVNNFLWIECRADNNAYGVYMTGGGLATRFLGGAIEANSAIGLTIDGQTGGVGQATDVVLVSGVYFENTTGSPTADISIGPNYSVTAVTIDTCYFNPSTSAAMRHIDCNKATRVIIRGGHIWNNGAELASLRANATNTTNLVLDNIRADGTVTGLPATVNIIDPATSVTPASVGVANVAGASNYFANALHVHANAAMVLDDLTDVTITSVASGDRLRYSGSAWVNSTLHWEPHVAYDGTVVLNGSGDPVMVEVL